jgi:hypothetical protein
MNGAWKRWLGFTYTDEVFSRIVKEQGYKQREELNFVDLKSNGAPKWWPDVDWSRITLYLRGHEDTQPHDLSRNVIHVLAAAWLGVPFTSILDREIRIP